MITMNRNVSHATRCEGVVDCLFFDKEREGKNERNKVVKDEKNKEQNAF